MQNDQRLHELNDDELVCLVQGGENEAFAVLIERYQTPCQRVAVSILRDKSDAEDEVQNALWKAFQHINQFQRDARFSSWLTRIVVNQCLMRLRQTRRAKFFYMDDTVIGEETQTIDLPDRADTPEQRLGQTEVAQVLKREIERIPPLLRHAFVLRDIEQLPIEDVADRLGISVPAAKSRLLRARLELRNRLQRHYGRMGPATLFA
ncbi:MAG TPA: sigma-70 family RNA polymerase sigma factor [Bryobacteraceae bacterium]|jgi:RNA polymerase sigma-70 factor (ECF subfamily)|nr:sigma-70 family RNA polymerase sigma factor [Bryobacteraceae bacterium]